MIFLLLSVSMAHAVVTPGRLSTTLTASEVAREVLDESSYPSFAQFLKSVRPEQGMRLVDPRNRHLIPTAQVFVPSPELWRAFFRAAAADRMTVLRAFALVAREIKKHGVVMFGPGRDFEQAVREEGIDLGLALPASNVALGIWSPDPKVKDPEFLLHLKVFYTEAYTHRFPDEILPANLKIGLGAPETYWLDGTAFRQPTVTADLYYGPKKGVGFRNVRGVGGQKRGFLGFMQKLFFFLPDAVDAMRINEDTGEMVTEAIVDTTVKDFERDPRYAIKRNGDRVGRN
jgi:hypothetical protein